MPSTPAPTAPSVPTGLAATGSLRNIHLGWNASTGGNLTGYNLYRSTDGTTWTKLNASTTAATGFDDAIASPAGDGVVYQYQVTSVGGLESAPSTKVLSAHGTRLPAHTGAGFITSPTGSPYVAEGTVVVDGGNLVVEANTKLYVVNNARVDLEQGNGVTAGRILVRGLLRVLATPAAHATFTAHKVGGTLANNDGFSIWFDGATSYNAADGSGTLLQNALITNLASGNVSGGFQIFNCSPKLYNLNATSNSASGGSYIFLLNGAGAIIQNCAFNQLVPSVQADLRGTAFKMDHNRFRGGYYGIFVLSGILPLNSGQIDSNDFDGTKQAYLQGVAGSTNVPVRNNFWNGGAGSPPLPAEILVGTALHFDFAPALGAAPAGVGPTWQP